MKLILLISFIAFIFLCSSEDEPFGDLNYWCGEMPHPKTCYDFVPAKHLNSSKTFLESQFLNMSVVAAMDNAILVLKQTKRMEAMTPPGTEKGLWHNCVEYCDNAIFRLNFTLDHPGEPVVDPCQKDTEFSVVIFSIDDCKKGFERRRISLVFSLLLVRI
ncbi:hypothetical protein L6452_12475 [Arctium lappa]|uniref:Uncharacterized protein n=1 Tax=Arctium lappa TaxID=4217 RepID=A0ACB9DQJ7_ARCLA|nr:hypothetical protein L6452_12475 [Arctium lappa]